MQRSTLECLRIAAGLTQHQMAARLKTSPASYQRVEAGTAPMSATMKNAAASCFGIAPELLDAPKSRRAVAELGKGMVRVMQRFAAMPPKTANAGKQPFPRNFRLK